MKRNLLQLERAFRQGDILIKWETLSHSPQNKNLWFAFGLAFFLHFTAFCLFRVQPFRSDPLFTFSPINMQADLPYIETITMQALPRSIVQELIPPLDLPQLAILPSKRDSPFNLAESLEVLDIDIKDYLPSLPYSVLPPPLRLFISGELAQRPLMNEKEVIKEVILALPSALYSRDYLSSFRAKYALQIDGITGKVFWYQKIETTGKKELDLFLEKVLRSLLFARKEEISFEQVTGEIEFFISLDTRKIDK